MTLLPDENLGVAVLLNSRAAPANAMLFVAARIFDHYLGLDSRAYIAELTTQMQTREQTWAQARAAAAARNPAPALDAPLETYSGVYRDKLGLDVRVFVESGRLFLTYGDGERAALEYKGHEVFTAHWQNIFHDEDQTSVSFAFDGEGDVARVSMALFGDRVEAQRTDEHPAN